MGLRMARPVTRSGTANASYRKRIPADVKRILDTLPASYRRKGWGQNEITITLGTTDRRKAAAEFARISAEVKQRFADILRAYERSHTRIRWGLLARSIGRPECREGMLAINAEARRGSTGQHRF